jgi:TetR/AcrR family transcriptional regulator, tetracycline repressor protein
MIDNSWPWPVERRRSRPALTRDQLVRAALALLDEVGLDRLTTRRLAERLGVQSPSLYWHVRDKDQLLLLLADTICGEIETPPVGLGWRAYLETTAWEYRRVLKRHRDAALLLATTLPVGPNRLRLAERGLAALIGAGLPPALVAGAGFLMTDYVTNFVLEEQRTAAQAAAFAETPDTDGLEAIRRWFESLPADEYPTLVALAPQLADADAAARFRFGVTTILDGLAVRLQSQA